MSSKIIKNIGVGLLLMLVLVAGAMNNHAAAQWGNGVISSEDSSYTVYPAYSSYPTPAYSGVYPVYSGVYPAYSGCCWRPFGGLFAGLAGEVANIAHAAHALLCPLCHHNPCRCFVPATNFCADPCDPCDVCGTINETPADCGCADGFAETSYSNYYRQPLSQTVGSPSPTGFGSVTPITSQPTQVSSNLPAQPITTNRPLNVAPQLDNAATSNSVTPPNNVSPQVNLDERLNGIQPREPFVPKTSINTQDRTAPINPIPETVPTMPSDNSSTLNGGNNNGFEPVVPPAETTPATPTLENSPAPQPNFVPQEPLTTTYRAPSKNEFDAGRLPMPVGIPQSKPQSSTNNSANPLRLNLNSGSISVTVPENAKVFINGYETKMTGTHRTYVVNHLETGKQYYYEMRIAASVNGRMIEKTHILSLIGGHKNTVAIQDWTAAPTQNKNVYLAARPVQ